ncbi:iron-sulfur cluster loop [Brachyspira intermedia]|uniref:iron-sulfur cluster loop n=1 Tax=Brachyspira intermedia TaxID=84377 RepID=UPI0030077EA3
MDKKLELLLNESDKIFNDMKEVYFLDDKDANTFLNKLGEYPHAFVLGCLMDVQIDSEKACIIPYKIYKDLGHFDIYKLKEKGLDYYKDFFNKNGLHRFKNKKPEVFYNAIERIIKYYDGDVSKIWENNPSSASVVYKFLEFKGCGQKVSSMAANILANQFKIKMSDYKNIDISTDDHIIRIIYRLGFIKCEKYNELTNEEKKSLVIERARELNPEFPGKIDFVCWKLGRDYCHKNNPDCDKCYMNKVCAKMIN